MADKQVPKALSGGNQYELWGAVLCGTMFTDVRELQELRSDLFRADYLSVLVFVGRGRFDIKYPVVDGFKQTYVWSTGGLVLDFLDSQEAAIFRCRVGQSDAECFR